MRRSTAFVVVLTAVLAITSTGSGAFGAGDHPTASSASPTDRLAELVGSWKCSIKLPAMMGNPAGMNHGVWTFAKSQGGAIHAHWTAPGYESDDYYGYDAKTKTYWIAGTDTAGVVGTEASKDDVTFSGSYVLDGVSSPERDTITHPTATTFRDRSQAKVKGVWSQSADLNCTKM